MKSILILSLLILSAATLGAQSDAGASAPAVPAAPSGKQTASYEVIPVVQAAGGAGMAVELTRCIQFKAPEVNFIRCVFTFKGSAAPKSFAGHFEIKDRAGKSHNSDYNGSTDPGWKAGDTTAYQLDLNLEEYEAASVQWTLEGSTDAKGKHAGKEPQQQATGGPDAIDTICKQRGYQK